MQTYLNKRKLEATQKSEGAWPTQSTPYNRHFI